MPERGPVNLGTWRVRYLDGHGNPLERVTEGVLILDKDGWALVIDATSRRVLHAVYAENLLEVLPADTEV